MINLIEMSSIMSKWEMKILQMKSLMNWDSKMDKLTATHFLHKTKLNLKLNQQLNHKLSQQPKPNIQAMVMGIRKRKVKKKKTIKKRVKTMMMLTKKKLRVERIKRAKKMHQRRSQ